MSNICVLQGGASDRFEKCRSELMELNVHDDAPDAWKAICALYNYAVAAEKDAVKRYSTEGLNTTLKKALVDTARALANGKDAGGIIALGLSAALEHKDRE